MGYNGTQNHTQRGRLRRAVPTLCPPGRWAHAEQVARACYRRRNALPTRDLVVDLMVADIARGYVNTGVFPRADVDPVAHVAEDDDRAGTSRIWGQKEQY